MEQQLEKLTQLGTDAVQAAITQYTQWFVVSSLCWLAFGAACAIAAETIWRKRNVWIKKDEYSPLDFPFLEVAAILLGSLAILTVPLNIPTLLQPRAYAIHQLITDAR